MNKFEYSITFKNVQKGLTAGAITLPCRLFGPVEGVVEYLVIPHDNSVELVYNSQQDANQNMTVRSKQCYTDYEYKKVTIETDGLTVWNELKIKVIIEEF